MDYDVTMNRFNPENRFIGDIEDGKRYPLGVYTKEECDALFAVKQTETDLSELSAAVNTKAAQADLESLSAIVATKADESEAEAIRARLDALEYEFIQISSFAASPTLCEYGTSNTINLSWILNKAAASQQINGMPVTGNSWEYINVSNNITFNLSVSDGKTSANAAVSVEFANQIYHGAAEDLSVINLITLPKILSNEKARTLTETAGVDQYIVYAIPERLGTVVFYVGGFEGGFDDPVMMNLTNNSGYTELYRIYKSTQPDLGTITLDIREG